MTREHVEESLFERTPLTVEKLTELLGDQRQAGQEPRLVLLSRLAQARQPRLVLLSRLAGPASMAVSETRGAAPSRSGGRPTTKRRPRSSARGTIDCARRRSTDRGGTCARRRSTDRGGSLTTRRHAGRRRLVARGCLICATCGQNGDGQFVCFSLHRSVFSLHSFKILRRLNCPEAAARALRIACLLHGLPQSPTLRMPPRKTNWQLWEAQRNTIQLFAAPAWQASKHCPGAASHASRSSLPLRGARAAPLRIVPPRLPPRRAPHLPSEPRHLFI